MGSVLRSERKPVAGQRKGLQPCPLVIGARDDSIAGDPGCRSLCVRTRFGFLALVPTFRLPTLIHTRSANAKWLVEISHSNPTWIHTSDAARLGVRTGDLVRVETEIGYFVIKALVTVAGTVKVASRYSWRPTSSPPTESGQRFRPASS